MNTIPTPPVLPESATYDHVKPYPLRFSTSTALLFRAYEYDELSWWRRLLVRWLLGYDLGDDYRGWAKATTTEDDLHQVRMVSREELEQALRDGARIGESGR